MYALSAEKGSWTDLSFTVKVVEVAGLIGWSTYVLCVDTGT